MTFKEYQQQAIKTDVFGGKPVSIKSPAFLAQLLGLMGETGEVSEKFKKLYRDKDGQFTEDDRLAMLKELGDVLWYLSVVSTYLNIDLDSVAVANIAKLADRQKRGTLRGSGDNR